MTEPLSDLATARFRLRLHPDYPLSAEKEWYGKAIRAIFLRAIKKGYSARTSAAMHTDNQLRAYSVSNLSPDPRSEEAQATREVSFRISVCQKENLLALLHCTLPGGELAPGSQLNLSGLHCQLVDWHLCDRENYADLYRDALSRKPQPCETIDLRFESPVFFKDTKTRKYTPEVTPMRVFGSLASKWQTFTSQPCPKDFEGFLQKHVFVNAEGLTVVDLGTGSNTTVAALGLARFISDRPEEPAWRFLHCLARFAEFAGVGKDTAIGFGQIKKSVSRPDDETQNI